MKCSLIFVVAALACAAQGESLGAAKKEPSMKSSLIGGSRVSPFGREYAVMLRLDKSYRDYVYCNGVRLNENWLVTAAQCANKKVYDRVRYTFSVNGTFVHKFFINRDLKHVIHPDYEPATTEHNIALIQVNLGEWKDQNQHLKLPSGPSSFDTPDGIEADVTGFERNYNTGGEEESIFMNSFTVKTVNYTQCKGKYRQTTFISQQICSSSVFTGQSRGLSEEGFGTPMVLKNRTFYGIAQHVSPSPLGRDEPIIFHKMHSYSDWIHKITGIHIEN